MIPASHRRIELPDEADRTRRRYERGTHTPIRWWPSALSCALIVAANFLAISGLRLPFVGAAIGFWFILVYPVYLCYTSAIWRGSSAEERVGYSVATVLLLLLVAGLAINTVLPEVGVDRPLDAIPVAITVDILTASLFYFRHRHPGAALSPVHFRTLGRRECRLLVASAICVPLAVLGANRLNNGAGDQLSLAALACMLVTLALLLRWQRWVRDGVASAVLYVTAMALLLMTSLRGWSVTGHDIQTEYRVFQLTESHGHWSISYLQNAYNACLSITILPTEIERVAGVDGPYIYKVFFQILFALTPVLVYAIARRHCSKIVSIMAAIYFISFPTFFIDMPYENRQEIAFIFVGVALLSITNIWWPRRQRQAATLVAAVGIELSHYSTMYIFLGTLLISWIALRAWAVVGRYSRRRRNAAHAKRGRQSTSRRTINVGVIAALCAILFAWGDLATHTSGPAISTAESAIAGLIKGTGGSQQGVLYGLLHSSSLSPRQLLANYYAQTLKENAADPAKYIPAAGYKTPFVDEPSLPLTNIGRVLARHAIPVAGLNNAIRQGAAKDEQLFLGVAVIAILLNAGYRRRISAEFFSLCIGSLVMIALITLLPDLSVQYGVLRAFLEGLIFIAPLMVLGSETIFSLLGGTWKVRAACFTCLAIFFSTTGLMPQLLGSYAAQLSLNNSGQYYDNYYMHPQEVAAVNWLAAKPGVVPSGLQASFFADRFYFTSPSDVTGAQIVSDAYPTLIQRSSWVILGYATLHTGRGTVSLDSDSVNYVYPIGVLARSKNLVYNNGGAEIYR